MLPVGLGVALGLGLGLGVSGAGLCSSSSRAATLRGLGSARQSASFSSSSCSEMGGKPGPAVTA